MRKLLYILLLMPTLLWAQNATMDAFFQTLQNKTLQGDFRITVATQADQPLSYHGTIQMRGECFYLTLADMELSYDGSTLYNYSETLEELTLSAPTQEELKQANPLLFAQALVQNSTVTQTEAGENYVFKLVPKAEDTGVQSFVLHVRKADLMPIKAIMRENAQSSTTLQILNAKYTNEVPSFVLTKPNAFVNDIR